MQSTYTRGPLILWGGMLQSMLKRRLPSPGQKPGGLIGSLALIGQLKIVYKGEVGISTQATIQFKYADTAFRAAGEPRILILDGHGSHCNVEFFQHYIEHKIYPICLPSHSTHLLQPLDVELFESLQKSHSTELDEWHRKGNNAIRKDNFHE